MAATDGGGGATLVALCASHLDGPARQDALRRMLRSVSQQTRPIELFLSVSGASESEAGLLEREKEFAGGWLHVRWRGEERLAQFQHYRLLCDELAGLENEENRRVWCLFTDDDDEWHERRAEHYADAVRRGARPTDDAVVCVGGRMLNGRLAPHPVEYFEFAARLAAFRRFFRDVRPETLAIRGCDLVWRNVMRQTMGCAAFRCADGVPWLYRQVTPQERMEELDSYLGAAEAAWNAYVEDSGCGDRVPVHARDYVLAVLGCCQ